MKTKLKTFCYLLFVSVLLSGCTVTSNRIYTVCCVDNGEQYCYDSDGKFYHVVGEQLMPYNANNLIARPCLPFNPTCGEYSFSKVMVGHYRGTLVDVERYVYDLCSTGGSYFVSRCDSNMIDIYVNGKEYNTRIIFHVSGDVNIYSVDFSGNAIDPHI